MLNLVTHDLESERLPALPVGEAEATRVTFLCADVVGFTAMTERLGDPSALGVMREVARTTRQHAAEAGGRMLEIRGDAFLMSFDEPLAALGSARALQRQTERDLHGGERVQLRIAIHTGEVLRDGDGYFGRDLIVPYRVLPEVCAGGVAITTDATEDIPDECLVAARLVAGFAGKGLAREIDFFVFEPDSVRTHAAHLLGDLCDPSLSIH